MVPTISVTSLHLEYQLWIRELIFYKEEIKIFESNLESLIEKNTNKNMRAMVEHFQKQFILQKELIDHLKHDLHVSEKQLASFVHELSGARLENVRMDNHPQLRERIATFRKIYKDMKSEFREFESRWM